MLVSQETLWAYSAVETVAVAGTIAAEVLTLRVTAADVAKVSAVAKDSSVQQ